MDTEAELIKKYEHVLATIREQIRGLKNRVSGRRTERKRESPMRGNGTQELFKEELVRKEFELEECLLELDELKSELRRQTLPKDSPFPLSTSPPPDDGNLQPTANTGYNTWEELPVREDLSHTSEENAGMDEEGELQLLRKKVDVIDRENRILREKADLYDTQIQSLQTRLQKSSRTTLQQLRRPEEARPSIQHLRREVKNELNREVVSPQSMRIQKKLESLHESVWAGNEEGKKRLDDQAPMPASSKQSDVSSIAALLLEKENAIQDMTSRLDTLTEEYQAMVETKAAKEREREQEIDTLRQTLEEKDRELEAVRREFEEMQERMQEMAKAMGGQRPESQPVNQLTPRLDTDPDLPQQSITETTPNPSPDPKPVRQPGALKPLANSVKEAVGRQTVPSQAKAGVASRVVAAFKGGKQGGKTLR